MKSWPIALIACSIVFITIFPSGIWSKPVILDDHFTKSTDIDSNAKFSMEYYTDETGKLSIEEVFQIDNAKWNRVNSGAIAFGYSTAVFWLRFSIKNTTNHDIDYYLQQSYPSYNDIRLYEINPKKIDHLFTTGINYPFSERAIKDRTFIFPLLSKAGSQNNYYLRMHSNSPLLVDLRLHNPATLEQYKNYITPLLWMYYGILIIMGIYNLFIFFSIRNFSYLLYFAYVALFIMFINHTDGIWFQYLWSGGGLWAYYYFPVCAGFIFAAFVQFTRYFIDIKRYSRIWNIVFNALSIFSILSGLLAIPTGNVSFFTMIISSLATIGAPIVFLYALYLAIAKKSKEAAFFSAASGFLILGSVSFVITIFGLMPRSFFTSYGFHIGTMIQVFLLSLGLTYKINYMEKKLEKAEQKYRHLVESSHDIIFSLDDELNFITVNKAIKQHLGYNENDIINKNLMDLIQDTWSSNHNIGRELIEEQVFDMKEDKESVSFRADFKTRYSPEPKDLAVKLEYIQSGKNTDILGKASIVSDDILVNLLDGEKQTYRINNYLNNVPLLSQRITRNMEKYCSSTEAGFIKIALREVILNAIEHGNLGIRFEEKHEVLQNNNYLHFLFERQKDPRYKNKKVTVEYSINSSFAAYRITDDGNGFDHKKVLESASDTANQQHLSHGRGLAITVQAFDLVDFNEKGNQVLLVKYFNDSNIDIKTCCLFIDDE
ncbi:MAG: PAS domain S-box protein [bacterium]|nr:PAS domain S-box protein [bacterium]